MAVASAAAVACSAMGTAGSSLSTDASPERTRAAASPSEVPRVSYDAQVMDRRFATGRALFDYDQKGPLASRVEKVGEIKRGVRTTSLSYASPVDGRVPATLIAPDRPGPLPALIIMHGLPGRRTDLILTGQSYARSGAVVLLIDAPFARPANSDRVEPLTFTPRDRDEQIQLIVDLRRAVDLLRSRPEVDPDRIGYVGISYGASMGGLLAGVEDRIAAYALVVGDGGLVAHFTGQDEPDGPLQQLDHDARIQWLQAMEPIEPVYFVRHARVPKLLQSGRRDQLVSPADADVFHRFASEPKQVIWYDAGHQLDGQADCDRLRWLDDHLDLPEELPSRCD